MRILPRRAINPLIRTMPPPRTLRRQPQLDIICLVRRKVKRLVHLARLRIRRRPGPMDLEHGRPPGIPPPLAAANRRGVIAAIPAGARGGAVRRPKQGEELGQQRAERRQARARQGGREFADAPA